MTTMTTAELYDHASAGWQRGQPVLLSDFTARPFVLRWVQPVAGKDVLDLGCGEGYVARQLAAAGAGRLAGVDVSAEMVRRAQEADARQPQGIEYRVGDACDLDVFADASFDLVVAVFLFNYLDRDATLRAMREVRRLLRPGGRFVFTVPHPSLPFVRPEEPPFYFAREGAGYLSGRDHTFEGRIWRRDGQSVPVRCVHKTFDDYFTALRGAGFDTLPDVAELHVTPDMVEIDPDFFGPLLDVPLHVAFRVEVRP